MKIESCKADVESGAGAASVRVATRFGGLLLGTHVVNTH